MNPILHTLTQNDELHEILMVSLVSDVGLQLDSMSTNVDMPVFLELLNEMDDSSEKLFCFMLGVDSLTEWLETLPLDYADLDNYNESSGLYEEDLDEDEEFDY